MPRKPATEAQRDEERARIRRAAATIYREEGLSAISARSVAKKADVSVGKIYAYFDNLADLMQSLWIGRVDRLNADLEAVARAHSDPIKRIRELMKAYIGFATDNPDLYKGAFLYVRPQGHEKPEARPIESAALASGLIDALKEGQKQGRIRKGNPKRLAQVLWAGIHGSIALPTNIDRIALEESRLIAKEMIQVLMDALEP